MGEQTLAEAIIAGKLGCVVYSNAQAADATQDDARTS